MADEPRVAENAVTILVAERLGAIRERIARAARRVGRDPAGVRLVVVSKGVPIGPMKAAREAGARMFGESRLQEADEKMAAMGRCEEVEWHFIGRLQRRKVKSVVGRFALIHSVDSLALAEEINQRAGAAGLDQAVLVEVNIGLEASKGGFAPAAVAAAVREMDRMPHLLVRGLMAIPPQAADPELSRPHFRELGHLGRSIGGLGLTRVRMDELSMGMSSDFEVAVEEGATFVRVGTAIFGARHA